MLLLFNTGESRVGGERTSVVVIWAAAEYVTSLAWRDMSVKVSCLEN